MAAHPWLLPAEIDLVKASAKGDTDAFNQLVLSYQQLVYNVAYRMLSNSEDAADATQDTFISAFRKIDSFRGGSFKAWLLKIVANSCYDRLRSRKRRPALSLEAAMDSEEAPIDPPDPTIGPEAIALKREFLELVQRGLDTLQGEQRLVVILSDVQGFSYDEIAEITGANLGTVKSRLSRGRADLRDFLKQSELTPSRFRLNK